MLSNEWGVSRFGKINRRVIPSFQFSNSPLNELKRYVWKAGKGTFYFSLLNEIRLGRIVPCQELHRHRLERSATTQLRARRKPRHNNIIVCQWPVAKPANWVWWVNQPQTDAELEDLRHSVNRGTPYGIANWVQRTAKELGIEASLRPRGRPPNRSEK